MRIYTLLFLSISLAPLIAAVSFYSQATASASLGLQMTITPLTCSIELVDDGYKTIAYTDSNSCQKALEAEHPYLVHNGQPRY